MPSSHRAPFNPALLEPAADDGADQAAHAVADRPSPWPWRVAVPVIAGLSLALWVGLAAVLRLLGAG